MSTTATVHGSARSTEPGPPAGASAGVDRRAGVGRIVGLAAALAVGLAVLLSAFAWPATENRPRELPVAVAGPPQAVEQLRAAVEQAQPGAFALVPVPDGEQARELVAQREVDGALVLGPDGAEAIIASQGSPATAQAITALAQAAGGAPAPAVQDLAPLPADDPRGAGLAAGALPFAMVGGISGMVLWLGLGGQLRRAAGAVLFALLAGPIGAGILHGWLGALTGNWWAEAAVISLGLGAASLGVLGAGAIAGRAGVVAVELAIIVVGNPLSAAPTAPAFLPDGWSELGQALPPGAIVAALRAVSGFDGTGAAGPLTVLAVWAVGGLLLMLLAAVWRARPAGRPA